MKKAYLEPQVRPYMFSPSLMDDEQTSATVHNDDPQDPGGALGNSMDTWDEGNTDVIVYPNVWEEE